MRLHALVPIAALLLASPALAQPKRPTTPEEQLAVDLADLKRNTARAPSIRHRIYQRVKRVSDKALVRRALLAVARSYDWKKPQERQLGTRDLRQLSLQRASEAFRQELYREIQVRLGWSFVHVTDYGNRHQVEVQVSPAGRPASALSAFRLRNADVIAAALRGEAPTRVPRKAWESLAIGAFDAQPPRTLSRAPDLVTAQARFALPTRPGVYLVEEVIEGFRHVQAVWIRESQLVLHVLGKEALVYVIDPVSGEPKPNVAVSLISEQGRVDSKTDASGLARLACGAKGQVIAQPGNDLLLCRFDTRTPEPGELVYITTDRPVYRPGQTVRFKAVCRKKDNALPSRDPVKVDVRDPLGRIVWQGELPWSAQGTLSGTFTLAKEPGLGDYSVFVHVPRQESPTSGGWFHDDDDTPKVWTKTFSVLAYRKPAAKISIEVLAPTQPGGLATAVLRAEYFHGGPVVDGAVNWRVTEAWEGSNVRSGLLRPRPPFEDPLAWLYEGDDARYEAENDYSYYEEEEQGEEILAGTGKTGPDGTLRIRFPTKSGGRWGRSYQVHAEVSDDSRLESEISSPRLTLEASSLQLDVGPRRLFEVPGEPVQIGVRVSQASGESPGMREVTLVTFRTPNPFQDSVEFESVSTHKSTTDVEGLVWFTIPAQSAGRLRFVARAKDSEGRAAIARCGTWVAGDAAVAPASEAHQAYYCSDCDQNYGRPFASGCLQCQGPLTLEYSELPEPSVSILGQELAYREGATARFMVQAPSVPLTCLLTVEGEGFLLSKVVRLTERSTVLELPVGKDWAPNVLVKLKGWRNHQGVADGVRVVVLAGGEDVQVALTSDRPSYSPGEKAQLVVTTTRDGAPVSGEIELAIVDEKILQLRADQTPDIRDFFRRLRTIETHVDSTGQAVDAWRRLSERGAVDPDTLMFGGGGGGGGGGASFSFEEADEEEDAAAGVVGALAPPRLRRRFPDTLFYRAHVLTGPDGRALIPVDMADELTRWRVMARAVVGRDGFGQAEASFRTRQDVVLSLATPRFMVEGDLATVATVVHNKTGEAARFTLTLESPLAKVQGGPRSVVVPGGASTKLDWEVIALQPGLASFKARAVSKRGSDAVELEVPIKPFGTPQVRLLAGETKAGEWKATLLLPDDADPERAVLDLSVAGGPLAAIEQALPFLAGFPYGCVEQTMSRFLPAVVASAALERAGGGNERLKRDLPTMVNAGLQRLYGFQHDDGGWGWWKHDDTDPEMTTYVLFGLLRAKAAGVQIDPKVLQEGLDCLRELEPTAFGLYVRALSGEKDLEELRQVYPRTQTEFAYLVMAGRRDLIKELALAPPAQGGINDVLEASLVLRALVAVFGQRELRVKELTTWLLAQRKGPKWHTTLDTAYVILALSEVAEKGAETMVRSLRVNGKEVPAGLIKDGRVTLPKGWIKRGANHVALQTANTVRAFASARLSFLTHADPIPAQESPALKVRREVQIASGSGDDVAWKTLADGATVRRRDRVRLRIKIVATRPVSYSLVESPLPAGAVGWSGAEADQDDYWWDETWYQRREFRDDRVSVCGRELDEGESEVIHELRFTHPGSFRLLPARAEGMYDPLAVGTSRSFTLKVVD